MAPNDPDDELPNDTADLQVAAPTDIVRLRDGDRVALRISPVAKEIEDHVVRMLAYGGSIPGPCLHVDQGSGITVEVTNEGDLEATVHWHGLRLENRYDGVPHETQPPIPVGGTFVYELRFPDPGLYWYHPHIREDVGIEMGLYGTILVEPRDPSYWPHADRQLPITLDDLLIEGGRIAPFRRSGPTRTAMGRYGTVMLVNGSTRLSERVAVGEVLRLHLVNTANTRLFDVAVPGARMKLVGGDSGRYEHETFVEELLLAPSERAIVDVLFDQPGDVRLEHRTPERTYALRTFAVSGTSSGPAAATFHLLRTDPELTGWRQVLETHRHREPDHVLGFTARMPLLHGDASAPAAPGRADGPPATHGGHGGHGGHGDKGGHGGHVAGGDGLEWEDLMPDLNRATDSTNMIWKVVDRRTGAENERIDWSFTVGDQVKIRLVNEIEGSEHPMHHPLHIHGAGRFLVLSRQGAPEENLVWKDTVLVPAGHTVDILLDVTNPGRWMAHCHIAEHNQDGMMFSFDVAAKG